MTPEQIIRELAERFDLDDTTQLAEFLCAAFDLGDEEGDEEIYQEAMTVATAAAFQICMKRKLH